MGKGILLVDMCRGELFGLEFVKPIETMLKSQRKKYFVKKYSELCKYDFEEASEIILEFLK